jgi:ribonuclease E
MKDNTAAVHAQVPVDVATFLLNEKRTDVQAVELRHKVTVLLIPNVHLETPQHTVLRVRHDAAGQEELQQASYRMVAPPAEDGDGGAASPADSRAPRAEAAIRGITPAQPAPLIEEPAPAPLDSGKADTAASRFLKRIVSWFRHKEAPGGRPTAADAARAAIPAPATPGTERGRRRSGSATPGGARRDDTREAAGGRVSQESREATAASRAESQKPREPRQPREPREGGSGREPAPAREPRRQRRPLATENGNEPAALAAVVATPAAAAASEQNGDESASPGRRRGRRGGRRERGERADARPAGTGETAAGVAGTAAAAGPDNGALSTAAPESGSSEVTTTAATPALAVADQTGLTVGEARAEATAAPVSAGESAPPVVAPMVDPVETTAQPPSIAAPAERPEPPPAASVAEPPPAEASTVAPAELAAEPPGATMRASEAVAAPEDAAAPATTVAPAISAAGSDAARDVQRALAESGLTMVETRQRSALPATPVTPDEDSGAPRRVRRRPPPVVVADEPMVLVETHK